MRGGPVEKLQRDLKKLGFEIIVDGIYGENTRNKVRAFQLQNAIQSDGIVGPKTWLKLEQALLNRTNDRYERQAKYEATEIFDFKGSIE